MPLYEYKCEQCSRTLEAIQRFSDDPLTTCPECNGTLRKLISSPAIKFKGAGFYINDYARSSAQSSNSTKESPGNGASSGNGSGTDSPASGTGSSDDAAKPASSSST